MILQVGVKAVLKNEKGDILLLRRSEQKYGKTSAAWDIPGGRIDPGSDLIENLKREVKEETGLALTSEPCLIGAQDILMEDRHVVRLTYTAYTEGDPVLDLEENTAYRWVSFSELSTEEDTNKYLKGLLESKLLTQSSWLQIIGRK